MRTVRGHLIGTEETKITIIQPNRIQVKNTCIANKFNKLRKL